MFKKRLFSFQSSARDLIVLADVMAGAFETFAALNANSLPPSIYTAGRQKQPTCSSKGKKQLLYASRETTYVQPQP